MPLQPPSLQYVDFPIFNALIPKEGPKAVPFTFDFVAQASYSIDLQNQQSRHVFSMIQTMWIDNSGNTQPVSITFDVIGQNVKFGPGWQGYFPVMVVNPPRFTISSAGGQTTKIVLLNVPFPAGSWGTTQQSNLYDSAGNLLVSDQILEAGISGNHFQSDEWIMGNNDTRVPRFSASSNIVGAKSTNGATSILAAGGAAANIFISSIDISISGNATSAAGTVVVSLLNGATAIFQHEVALPLLAGVGLVKLFSISNLNYLFSTLNTALSINLSAALTAGNVQYNIGAAYTSVIRP